MKRILVILCIFFISSCADTMRSAAQVLKTTNEFQKDDMTWILSHKRIYFGGEILGREKSTLHNVKSVEACENFNQSDLLALMYDKGLLKHRFSCIPYAKDTTLTEGLFIKQTSDLSMMRQDYYYVDHIDLSTGHIVKRQDIIEATYQEYANIWLFNSIIPIVTASRQQYANGVEWENKMNSICKEIESEFCKD